LVQRGDRRTRGRWGTRSLGLIVILRRAQVGGDDVGILLNVGRGSRRNDLAEVKDVEALGQGHNELHIVFNQEDRRSGLLIDRANQFGERQLL
jgi:hypothetical protein